jgi:hypothetical protein
MEGGTGLDESNHTGRTTDHGANVAPGLRMPGLKAKALPKPLVDFPRDGGSYPGTSPQFPCQP